jgi:phosphoribosylamine---glycine ligase
MDTNYNVLLIGSGGREHAIAWKLNQSPNLGTLYIAPGNPGTAELGMNVNLNSNDFASVVEFCKDHSIDLVAVGPEAPLVNGIVDYLEKEGVPVFGPKKAAALLEGSKQFAKEIMVKYDVPTADYAVFSSDEFDDALKFVQSKESYPIVLKADGLAAGKGVFICDSEEEVIKRLDTLKNDKNLQDAASKLVVEEFMEGEEASVFVIADGHTSHILHNAQDHKRIGEGDTGLNTGGMGAYSPAPVLTDEMLDRVKNEIIERTITGMQLEEAAYHGILYIGLMITESGPKVVEYNCRFGDPECQVILPPLENDLLTLMIATTEQRLDEISIQLDGDYRCGVVLASDGYPGSYPKGKKITGIESIDGDAIVFQAGTKLDSDSLVTNGGRVLSVVGKGNTLNKAISHAYKNVDKIHFEGCYYRKDIGHKGLKRIS